MSDENNVADKKVINTILSPVHSLSGDVIEIFGSFLAILPETKEGEEPNNNIAEGNFTGIGVGGVQKIGPGIYRVRLNVALPTKGEDGKVGLLAEPYAYVVSEYLGEFPNSLFNCVCSPYDAVSNAGTFDIATVVGTKAKDVGPTDRVFFRLAFRNVGQV